MYTGCILFVGAAVLLVAVPTATGLPRESECINAPFLSYHIHALFWQTNPKSTAAALTFQREFLAAWNVSENCTFAAGDPQPSRINMCAYEVDYEPVGPFLTAQLSFFVPIGWYERTVAWSMYVCSLLSSNVCVYAYLCAPLLLVRNQSTSPCLVLVLVLVLALFLLLLLLLLLQWMDIVC